MKTTQPNILKPINLISLGLVSFTLLSGIILASTTVSADVVDDVVDTITITVPSSCSMSSTIDTGNEHTAEINNGQYDSAIGETTIKAFCNDNEGFAIYAIGYTDNELGKNVLTNSTLGSTHDIATGTNLDGANSSWAMKLSTIDSPTPQYPIIIAGSSEDSLKQSGDPDFSNFTNVPDDYKKVAYRTAATDVNSEGSNTAEGSTLKTTYQAYISPTQASGEYAGQVKYTMIHPYNAPTPLPAGKIGVNYKGNGKTFAGGVAENKVVYANSPMYVATTPLIAKSPNVADDGTKSTDYAFGTNYVSGTKTVVPITAAGASKMKVVINYGVSVDTSILAFPKYWDGNGYFPSPYEVVSDGVDNVSGIATYIFDGDSITICMGNFNYAGTGGAPTAGYDYGFWAQVYPIYTTEQSGTEASDEFTTFATAIGSYATTIDWYGSWYADINGKHYDFLDEAEIIDVLNNNMAALSGKTINLYRGYSFEEAYARAGKTSTSGGYHVMQDLDSTISCPTIAVSTTSVIDERDDNVYTIAKLKDGNCWMLDNLALDPTDATTASNMNASNTNATAAAINNLLNGGSSITGWSSVAVADVDTNFNSFTEPRINNASKDTLVTSYGPASTNGQAKVGIYYNYCAASAGTYCYEYEQGVDVPDTLIDVSQDLCPANWRMPTGGNVGEQRALYNEYNTTKDATNTASLQYNLSTPLSGYYSNNRTNEQGLGGFWWSSTYAHNSGMFHMYTISTEVYPIYYYDTRSLGHTIRCLVSE